MTWLDASYEFETGTLGGPGVCVTVGFELPPRWRAHESFAAERTPEGFRAITHIPSVNIVKKEELDVSHQLQRSRRSSGPVDVC